MPKSTANREHADKAWSVGIVVAAVLLGVGLSYRTWRVVGQQRARTADYQKKTHDAEKRRMDLAVEKAKAEGPLGQEKAARDAGLTKPGEEPLPTK